jgi:hypothetical protein
VITDNPPGAADPAAVLDVQSSSRGFLFPRMGLTDRNNISSPPTGLIIFQTDNAPGFYYNTGTAGTPDWQRIKDETNIGGYWTQSGFDLYYTPGNVGIGTNAPGELLDVRGRPGTIRIDAEPGYKSTLHFGYNGTNRFTLFNRLAAGPPAYSADYLTLHSTESVAGTNPYSGSYANNPDLIGFHPEGRMFMNYQGNNAAFMAYSFAPSPIFYIEVYNGGADANGIQSRVTSLTSDVGSLCIGGWNEGNGSAVYGQNKLADNYGYLGTFNHGAYGENDGSGNRGALGTSTSGAYGVHDASGNQGTLGLSNFGAQGTHGTSEFWAALGTDNAAVYARLTPDGSSQSLSANDFAVKGVGVELSNVSNRNRGSNYSNQVGGIFGYNTVGTEYSSGVVGFTDGSLPDRRTAGVFGGIENNSEWGALGYEESGGTYYGGYFTSSDVNTGKAPRVASSSIGIGVYGDLFGAHIDGAVYGLYTTGNKYGLYSDGDLYRTGVDVHIQKDDAGQNTVMYTLVSPKMTIQTYGIGQLNSGKANISFDDAFASIVSDDEPIIVTVTPIGESEGVHLSQVNSKGFAVEENRAGKSNVQFSWIAIGKRKGFENKSLPADVIADDYNEKIGEGLHNDADMTTDGKGLYYSNGTLNLGNPSSVKGNQDPAMEIKDIKLERGIIAERDLKMDVQQDYNETTDVPVKKETTEKK